MHKLPENWTDAREPRYLREGRLRIPRKEYERPGPKGGPIPPDELITSIENARVEAAKQWGLETRAMVQLLRAGLSGSQAARELQKRFVRPFNRSDVFGRLSWLRQMWQKCDRVPSNCVQNGNKMDSPGKPPYTVPSGG